MARLRAPGRSARAMGTEATLAAWMGVSLALVAGLGWRDCVLLAAGVALALPAFRASMAQRAPWDDWRAALRCAAAGALGLLGALALVAWVAGVWMAAQPDRTLALGPALAVLALAGTLTWLGRPASTTGHRALAGLVLAWGVAAGVAFAARHGWAAAACGFALAVAVVVGCQGWRLCHGTASTLLQLSFRR